MEILTRKTFEIIGNKDLYEVLLRKEKYSEYINGNLEEHFTNLISEILELQQECIGGKGDIHGETLDVVYQMGQLINKLLNDNLIKDLDFKQQKNKIFKRSPNLKACKKVDRQTENLIWKLNKQNEKK